MKVFFKGLNNCTMRKQKLQQYRNFLVANGHEIVDNPEKCDVILVWTCAFRADVRDNSIDQVNYLQKEFKGKRMVVAGCLPDISPDLLKKNFSGFVANWRNDRNRMEEFFGTPKKKFNATPPIFSEENLTDDVEKYRKENPDKDATFHDHFVKLLISEGCNYECAYCSERLAFPPYRSFPEDELVEHCKKIVEKIKKYDVILLSDSLGEYGRDIGTTLPNLIRKLKTISPKLKIALNNMNPADFVYYFDDMVAFLKKGDIRHLNLPIQSASAKVLKLMNRAYTRQDLDKTFTLLNEMKFKEFDTHIIVGFPGETEADLQETIDFILRHKPKYALASIYMEAPEAPASKLPNKVDFETANRRITEVEKKFQDAGIICNSSQGKLSKDRLRRLNLSVCNY